MTWLGPVGAALLAYAVGSLSFAVIVSRALGLSDPRSYGSKNPGATNVLRSGYKLAAVLTLLLDAVKGWLPVVLVRFYGAGYGLADGTEALVGLAAFLGHLYPVFFGFKGGKGVATALGVLLGMSGWFGLSVAVIWLGTALLFRYSSLSSLVAALLAPAVYLLGDGMGWASSPRVGLCVGVMSLLLVYRHAANINRLIKGTESKLGRKKTVSAGTADASLPPLHGKHHPLPRKHPH
jgi:glycerol-3-phosphate acyltransferase PlsY